MRTTIFLCVAVSMAFAVTYFATRQPPQVPPEPAKPLTLAEIQQRLGAQHEFAAAHTSVATPLEVSTRADERPIAHVANANEQINRSMVGLPFAMSQSVVDECARWDCESIDKFLERMAAEPRDPDWAPRMEQFIEKWIEVEEEGALRIRALECRHDRCAIEVASEAQHGIQKHWALGQNDLYPSATAFGVERDRATGIVTYVSVSTWSRRAVFLADH